MGVRIMCLNIIELASSIVAYTQTLENELGQVQQVKQHVDSLLWAAQFIRDEITQYRFGDQTNHIPRSASNYAAAPFAIFKTGIYLLKKKASLGLITLSDTQIARLETAEQTLVLLEDRLHEIWATEEPLW